MRLEPETAATIIIWLHGTCTGFMVGIIVMVI